MCIDNNFNFKLSVICELIHTKKTNNNNNNKDYK